ncbi:long-chain fatty acid--CoA ligase [soil metagenome]
MAVRETRPVLLHEIIELAASDRPDDTALVVPGRRLSYGEFDRRVRSMARWLEQVVQPGDRVLLVSDNHMDVVTALYAVPATGAILAFGNTRHTPEELLELFDAVEPTVVVASVEQLERIADRIVDRDAIAGSNTRLFGLGGTHPAAELDLTSFLDAAALQGDALDAAALDAAPAADGPHHGADQDDCAWLIHTSGTTGRPKGVMLTHRGLVAAVLNTAVSRPLADDDVYLFPFPLFHVAAYNVLHAQLRRRPVVLVPRFDAGQLLSLIEEEQVTVCSLAPTMIAMLLDHADRADRAGSADLAGSSDHAASAGRVGHSAGPLGRLRQISYGASSMPLALLRRVLDELPGCGLGQGYGMTELSGNAVFLSPEEHRRAASDSPPLLAAAGRPGPLVAVRIVDDDDEDLDVQPGEPGEVLVRGDQVCAGYWNDPVATAESRLGEWFRTGDIGRIGADGELYIVDRKKDLIITGGENVASREVADMISEHPDVARVAVVGIPDERWGETVCAVVVPAASAPEPDADAIIRWSDGRLAGFKRPRVILFVEDLPVNASGKVDKRLVRTLALSNLTD